MVGVAGKSQGCNTCRKRKVKCDGERPSCGQCRKGKRVCGGYQRDRHFKNLSALDHDTLLARTQPLAPITQPSAIIYSDVVGEEGKRESQEQTPQEQPNIEALFFYLPPVSWLQALAPLQGTNSSFDIAMSALSMVRLGRQSGNETLRREGLANYGKALEGLQKVLSNGKLVFQEQTLAASMTLSIFEVLEVSGETTYGWISHIEGISRLFQLRGPKMHVSESGHLLFQGFRPTGILYALATRKATYLADQDWLTIPWTTMPKSDFHHLLDIMAKIPTLAEATERISKESNSQDIDSQWIECLRRNWDVHNQLDNFYEELSRRSTEQLYTETPATIFCTKSNIELEDIFPVSLHFPTFEIARIHLFYWAALLWIHNNISILQPSPSSPTTPSQQPLLTCSLEIATQIAQSMQYLLSPEMHTRGPQNVFHPLRIAQQVFSKKDQDGREVKWCKGVFEEVDARGYPFGKILSGWDWDNIPVLLSTGGSL
ncbi:uncharacterized protein PAC_11700 [Phialocephala subalpina]|uniref:Zn(2)-C6 fungal-type domain-containing protein n=1 Tax=Phialocephala subalpina TaxID=576137 RepID=A0A1L7X9U4_9HELO|nr:uncharacterized protein PAC_11700 [Phialocephala subalpina]